MKMAMLPRLATPQRVTFLCAFAKFRKATINFAISVCPSLRQHGTARLPLD